jgi:hypothetical protein
MKGQRIDGGDEGTRALEVAGGVEADALIGALLVVGAGGRSPA